MSREKLLEEAKAWLAADPDEHDRQELATVIAQVEAGDTAAETDLADRFLAPLAFGTAGLRGALGAGPNRMNTAVVTGAAAGLCAVLKEYAGPNFKVVVGYDGRYRSADLAKLTAGIVTAQGGKAYLFPEYSPTPLAAFSLRYLGADAAVVVTASHNPPADNGYKVYLGGSVVTDEGKDAQIVSPWDKRIQEAISKVGPANQVEVAESGWEEIDTSVNEAYIERASSLAKNGPKELRIVLTSMHGVGGKTCVAALEKAGFKEIYQVEEQKDPNPDFPTVAFPNPEEPGALDLAFKLAQQVQADVVIANDPDADRCSVAAHDGQGNWRQLSGDEIGALLGEQAAMDYANKEEAVLARSIVSGSLLDKIAEKYGLKAKSTLTGFKWISRAKGIVFGYEEAIGYCTDPAAVQDKDGISASVNLARLAAKLKAEGKTLLGRLDELALEFGLYHTEPLTFRVEDLSLIKKGMANLRQCGGPQTLNGEAVTDFVDIANGWGDLPATDALYFATDSGTRVIARPSGTEPKLKCYMETVVNPADYDGDVTKARQAAKARILVMKAEMTAALGF